MVYFGPKRYRPQRVGPTTRERAKILGSLALLLVLILTVWSMQRPEPEPSLTIPVMSSGRNDDGAVSADNTDSLGGSSSEGEVPEPVSLPSPDQGPPAEPFQENPAVLYAVRDSDAKVEGPAELAGLHYLLHRWRSDWQPEEITEPPEVSEIASQAAFMRGRRCLFVITLIENPRLRILEDNPSGLTSIWEAFGSDRSNRLHRINFISKPKNLPRSSEVLVTGDFLRLYRYETVTGMDGMVPEWVCGLGALRKPLRRSIILGSGNVLGAFGDRGFNAIGRSLFLQSICRKRPKNGFLKEELHKANRESQKTDRR